MGHSLAVLETYLKDILYSLEEITSKVELREHIFEIKDAENSLGFISLYDLKAYVFEHEEEARNYFVRNIDSSADDWKNIFEHPYFQRRKPQLVSADNLKDADDQDFFILIKGQKTGPFEKYELSEMVERKELLLTDMISFNGGHTWVKLYQVDGFDRRTLKDSTGLPGMPSTDMLQRNSETATEGQTSIGDTTDGFISLAFLGNQKKGRLLERQQYATLDDEMKKSARETTWYKWLLVASVCGILYFLYNIRSSLQSPFLDKAPATVGEQAEMLKPVETTTSFDASQTAPVNHRNSINDQRRMGKFETRRMNPVRPVARKSFMETAKFRETASDNMDNGEDQNYYYDNAAPMELDPVRAQISKENFDNGAEPAPMPDTADNLFNQEVSN